MDYMLSELCEQVTTARANYRAVEIVGGGTKRFLGNPLSDPATTPVLLQMGSLTGVVHYEPSELVMTVRAGTPLSQIEQVLAEQNQILAFDPPHFGERATIGGAIASGLSGPGSYGYGPLRNYVLGAQLLDAQGRVMRFGGEVMKNVAGYDVSRLLAGSMGIFGALVQVSLKVLPRAATDLSLTLELDERAALDFCRGLRSRAWPVKATAWLPADGVDGGILCIRLAGADAAVTRARKVIGGQALSEEQAGSWWRGFREQTAAFFSQRPLWRLAVRASSPALELGPCAFDLAGEVRWLVSDQNHDVIRDAAARSGGHATLFRHDERTAMPPDGVFQPLQPGVRAVVRRLKGEFDPKGIFNPGRLVQGL